MNSKFSENDTLKKISVLAVINILEPSTKKNIIKVLAKSNGGNNYNSVIDELVSDGFVAEEKGFYRVTFKGNTFNISRKANRLRDIKRMKHLLSDSKQRGDDYVGR